MASHPPAIQRFHLEDAGLERSADFPVRSNSPVPETLEEGGVLDLSTLLRTGKSNATSSLSDLEEVFFSNDAGLSAQGIY
jgi:hypothetical protein